MAIEVTSQKPKKVLWQNLLFYFSLFLVFLALAGFLALQYYFIPRSSQKMTELSEAAALQGTEEQRKTESEVLKASGEIYDFKILQQNCPETSKFFKEFEKWVHPKIYFKTLSLNSVNGLANLEGQADSFQTLIQQISILETKQEFIKTFELSNIALAEKGGVSFNLLLTLEPVIFK